MDAKQSNETVRIDLTPAQAQTVKDATGREAQAIELTVAELEQRIAPTVGASTGGVVSNMLAANSNETFLLG